MAKKNTIEIDIMVNGRMEKATVSAKKLRDALHGVSQGSKTADRNTKGLAQTASAGGKNFSKMATGISSGLVPAYAALAANIFAVTAAFGFLKRAAQIEILERSQVAYAQNTGVALDRLTESLKQSSQGMLTFEKAAEASAVGLAKGFSSAQMDKIAEGALKVSNALGRDFEDSFDRLVRGISKAEPELLDELGITLRLETATKRYAAAIGVDTPKALTTAQKSQAIYLESMRQLEEVTAGAAASANPFVQLGVTFSDLVKDIMQFLLPAFTALANFINNNAVAALAFFGLLAASVAKSLPFMDKLTSSFKGFAFGQKRALVEAKKDLDGYKKKLQEVKNTAQQNKAAGAGAIQQGARAAISGGAQSAVLMRAATGRMKGPDKANLKKALASAEKQYMQHGKITKGIFKGMSIDMVRQIDGGFKQIDAASKTSAMTMGKRFKIVGMQAKSAAMKIQIGFTKAFAMAGKAAKGFSRAMNLAMKATLILGLIQMIYDMVMALVNAPYSILKGIMSVGKGAMNFLQYVANTVIDMINYIIGQVNKIPGIEVSTLENLDFATRLNAEMDEYVESLEFVQKLKAYEQRQTTKSAELDRLKDIKDEALEVEKSLAKIFMGDKFTGGEEGIIDPLALSRAQAKAISSSGLDGLIMDAMTISDPARRKKALDSIADRLGDDFAKLSPRIAKALEERDTGEILGAIADASQFTANIAEVESAINDFAVTTQNMTAGAVKHFIDGLSNSADTAVELGESLGLTTDIVKQLDDLFKDRGGADAYVASLQAVEDEADRLHRVNHELKMRQQLTSRQSGALAADTQRDVAITMAQIALDTHRNNLQAERNKLIETMSTAEAEQHQNRIEQMELETELLETKLEMIKDNASAINVLGQAVGDSLTTGMQAAFNSIITGSENAKSAFLGLVQTMLRAIANVIAELLVAALIKQFLTGTAFGDFLGLGSNAKFADGMSMSRLDTPTGIEFGPSNRYGGVMGSNGKKMPGYAVGGIAKGPQSGYPVMMHGTEAVVPLPNGKSIPVEMKGNNQENNVVVNVSMNNDGSSDSDTQGDSNTGVNIGKVIAGAVQKELQNQKRAGGILNPYGAA